MSDIGVNNSLSGIFSHESYFCLMTERSSFIMAFDTTSQSWERCFDIRGTELLVTLPSKTKILIWDKIFIPITIILDFLTFYKFGKNILCVYEKI